jgi:hypothetical protein
MKKNLQSILVVALALITTVSYAQDWSVDSRTRIDMSGDNDKMETSQRVTVGTAWGGSDWGVVLSSDVNYELNHTGEVNAEVFEAYATTNLFGFATMNLGVKLFHMVQVFLLVQMIGLQIEIPLMV